MPESKSATKARQFGCLPSDICMLWTWYCHQNGVFVADIGSHRSRSSLMQQHQHRCDQARHPSTQFGFLCREALPHAEPGKRPHRKTRRSVRGHWQFNHSLPPVEIPFALFGPIGNPAMGEKRFGYEGKLKINRKDFGVNWSKSLDNGGLVVGNEVEIEINAEAVAQQ